jgi:pimeloyl-ACP methyl ester carboxylesterase
VTIYFFSGLGADKRAFKKIILPQTLTIRHIDWLDNSNNESLLNYCKRISKLIDTSEPFSFVGLSFGGIIAVELTKILNPKQVIIISSISTQKELPMNFIGNILLRKLNLYKLIPSSFFKSVNSITFWYFGTRTKNEKDLLRQIINDTPPKFAKWAIGRIFKWENNSRPLNLFHIHGSADKIFPIKKILADIVIPGGGHFMIYSHAEEISKILTEQLG